MIEISLMEMFLTTIGVLCTMGLLSCLCCFCMKLSDLKMKSYILEMAKRKGVKVDLEKLDCQYKSQSLASNENCTIIVPEVGIIL